MQAPRRRRARSRMKRRGTVSVAQIVSQQVAKKRVLTIRPSQIGRVGSGGRTSVPAAGVLKAIVPLRFDCVRVYPEILVGAPEPVMTVRLDGMLLRRAVVPGPKRSVSE